MITTYSHSAIEQPQSDLKSLLAEPFLCLGAALFWLVTLPLTALALFGMKIWDTITGLARRRSNPLILRRGNETEPVLSRRTSAHQS